MDLVQLRESGELSDIRVVINENEHHLHKFPLFIKSNFFKHLAEGISANADDNKVELEDFPGGSETFNLVADFCYNKRIDITLNNVVRLRCASEYMEMHGPGNLVELTERYLNDILTSARMSRSLTSVIDLLIECAALGEISEKAGVADKCLKAIVEIWMKPSSVFSSPRKSAFYGEADHITDRLLKLDLEWFTRLIDECKASDGKLKPLADLVCSYLARVFECEAAENPKNDKKEEKSEEVKDVNIRRGSESSASEKDKEEKEEEEEASEEKEKEDEEDEIARQLEEERKIARKRELANAKEEEGAPVEVEEEEESELAAIESNQANLPKLMEQPGKILDVVILKLPENTPLSEVIDVDWIRRAIEISEEYNCECRDRLLQLAGNILHRFTNEELKEIPSSVLCDIIENTIRNEKIVPEVLTCVLDNYLHDLARKGDLSPEDFIKLVKSVPGDYRESHDTLFEVMEKIISSCDSVPEELQAEMLKAVDLTRCHERTLQRALDKGVLPVKEICQAAIDLATKLRNEKERNPLHSYKMTIQQPSMRDAIKVTPSYEPERYRQERPERGYPDRAPVAYVAPSSYHYPDLDYPTSHSYTTYNSSPSVPLRSKGEDSDLRLEDMSTAALEDNLRLELNRISSSYDQYFRERAHRAARDPYSGPSRYTAPYKGSTRRW